MHTLYTRKILRFSDFPKARASWYIYGWCHPPADWKFFLQSLAWPSTTNASPSFHERDHDSVNVADLGLLKFGRCHQCCIGVKEAKQKETGIGCRSCMKYLCCPGCHEEYHRKNNILYILSKRSFLQKLVRYVFYSQISGVFRLLVL